MSFYHGYISLIRSVLVGNGVHDTLDKMGFRGKLIQGVQIEGMNFDISNNLSQYLKQFEKEEIRLRISC